MSWQGDRLDEQWLVLGLGWREASCLTNEELHGDYARAGRFQLAADIAGKT